MQTEKSFKSASGLGGAAFVAFFGLIGVLVVGGNAWTMLDGRSSVDNPAIAGIAMAALGIVPVMFLYLAWRLAREQFRFGRLHASIARFPSADSPVLQARINVPRSGGAARWNVSVRCRYFRKTSRGSGSNRSTRTDYETLWEEGAGVSASHVPPGVSLAFCLDVPEHLPPTDEQGRAGHVWEIVVRGCDVAGAELTEQTIRIPVQRPAIARQATFSAEELKTDRNVSDGRGSVSDRLMQLTSERAWFDESLWQTRRERRLARTWLTAFAILPVAVIAWIHRVDLTGVYIGLAGAPLPALLLLLRTRFPAFPSKIFSVLTMGAFFAVLYFGIGEAFFVAAILGILGPFALASWWGSSAFELHLSTAGIAKHGGGVLYKGETLAWQDIDELKVRDRNANALRRRERERKRRFVVVAASSKRSYDLSPPFEDADDAMRVIDWLDRARQRLAGSRAA